MAITMTASFEGTAKRPAKDGTKRLKFIGGEGGGDVAILTLHRDTAKSLGERVKVTLEPVGDGE